jgi:pimeloyl-ACP methyl ester carboxylesterase
MWRSGHIDRIAGAQAMTESTQITPFTIDIPQDAVDDLHARIANTRWAPDLEEAGWTTGVPTAYVRKLAAVWRDEFDWRAWESRLNAFPQFTTEIDGEAIHFLHVKSPEADATPLVLLHGWPGSILEFIHCIEPLANPVAHGGRSEDAFHLVIPSMPGCGFSGPVRSVGWTSDRTASAIAELMRRLGYQRYGAQGGDRGAFVGPALGKVDPESVIGVHVNAATWGFIPWGPVSDEERASLTVSERERLARLDHWNTEGNGYFQIQATRPQTLAAGLSDSPVGLLSWIGDSFKGWAQGGPEADDISIDHDIVLANISIYWFTNTIGSSIRAYYEDMHAASDWEVGEAVESDGPNDAAGWSTGDDAADSATWGAKLGTPIGVAVFAEDIAIRRYAEDMYTITHWSELERGGHFAALEAPDLLVEDVRTFFRNLRAAETTD